MNCYLAKLVYRIICGEGSHTAQFDEQIRLIYAEDYLHAFHKARLIGDSEGDNCLDDDPSINVKWKFIDVSELLLVSTETDGAEIYTIVKEEDDADTYIRTIKKKATSILQEGLQNFTVLNFLSVDN
ncbi:hypothetical protein BH11BAC3_BH11BAC3_41020 [soil metagenome]